MRSEMWRRLVLTGVVLAPMTMLLPACEEESPEEEMGEAIEERTDEVGGAVEEQGDQIEENIDEAY